MAVVATPVAARARFTYMNPNLQPLRIGGINPVVTAFGFNQFASALAMIQSAPVLDGFLTRETDLTQA